MTRAALVALRGAVREGREGMTYADFSALNWDATVAGEIEALNAYYGSLDAALALLGALLPGWQVCRFKETKNTGKWFVSLEPLPYLSPKVAAHDDTPARALLLATLEALIQEAKK